MMGFRRARPARENLLEHYYGADWDDEFGGGRYPPGHRVPPEPGRRRILWIALTGYCLFLLWHLLRRGQGGGAADLAVWQLLNAHRFVQWFGTFVLAGLWETLYFVPVGFLAALGVGVPNAKLGCQTRSIAFGGPFRVGGPLPRGRSGPHRLWLAVLAGGLGSALVLVLQVVAAGLQGGRVTLVGLILPVVGCLLGTWMGRTWIRGWRARLWFVPKAALLAALVAAILGTTLAACLEPAALPFEAAPVTSAEKRRLVQLIRSKSPRGLDEGQTHTLCLTEHDLNVLFSWGFSARWPLGRARMLLSYGAASLLASVELPFGVGESRYLNLRVTGRARQEEGGPLRLEMDQCRLGSLEMPRLLLHPLSSFLVSFLQTDRRSRPFVDAIRSVALTPEGAEVTYGRVYLPPGFREDLFGPGVASEQMLAAVQAHVDHLLTTVSLAGDLPPDFGTCLETVFTFAQVRSRQHDAVTENQAGIFALGMLLGHPRIEEFLGSIHISDDRRNVRRKLDRVPLRGRTDWTKHFFVSAAIAVFSDQLMSDAAGLLKEELDAGQGGSGFSFADLLADRAGTTFALYATRDAAAARALQDRLRAGFRIDDFFPVAADLPEGIPEAELQARYGGVGGKEYSRVAEEIERRIAACAAYR